MDACGKTDAITAASRVLFTRFSDLHPCDVFAFIVADTQPSSTGSDRWPHLAPARGLSRLHLLVLHPLTMSMSVRAVACQVN